MKLDKFDKFREKKVKKQQSSGTFEPLANDILQLKDDDSYEKVKGPIEVVQITGVLGEEEAEKLQETTMVPVNVTSTTKIGQTIWLTCIIKKPGDVSYNSQSVAVIKARVIDIFQGLNAINRIQ